MHAKRFLHKLLSEVMHQKRLKTLALVVEGVFRTKKISVTNLGRGIVGKMQERSAIRQADRLVGNPHLYGERKQAYEKVIKLVVGNKKRPKIIVDWSAVPNGKLYILRAGLVARGRALTLYEEVHKAKKQNNTKVHNKFLATFCKLLPKECRPIIVTDAGFHAPWFEQIEALGWDYVGRIRGTYKYSIDDGKTWKTCRFLFKKASVQEKSYGEVLFRKDKSIRTTLYLMKEKRKWRKARTKTGKIQQNKSSKNYSRSVREPWLLASSLGGKSHLCARRVKKIYQQRMQIEEGFRDLKSSRYGLSFEEAFSRTILRIENLLLIAMLSTLLAYLVGCIGEKNGLHRKFQVNSVKTKRVLSLFFLGCQMIKRRIKINIKELFSFIDKGFCYAE